MRVTHNSPIAEVAGELFDQFGPTLTAYLAKTKQRNIVELWANGSNIPTSKEEARLRTGLKTFQLMAAKESNAVARTAFIGINNHLRTV